MKHLLSLERLDVGRTLALTVGSPSAHRRGTMLKHVAFLLLFLFAGFGQMWGATVSGSIASSIAAGDQVVLVNTSEANELTGVSGNLGTQDSYSNGIPAGTCILTVEAGKSGTGTFSFKLSDNSYLAYTQATGTKKNNNLYLISNPTTTNQNQQVSWTVTINNTTNEATITNVYATDRKLMFNTDRFCCYTSNQTAVKFFKITGPQQQTLFSVRPF